MKSEPVSPPVPRSGWRSALVRVLRRLAACVAALGTLAALFYAVENWRGERAWRRMESDLRARGERLTLGEIVPPAPRDEVNAAAIPLFQGLFDRGDWTNAIKRLDAYSLPEEPRKNPTNDALGNLADVAGAMRRSNALKQRSPERGGPIYPLGETPGLPADDVLAGLAPMAAGLEELARAVRRPACQFPIHYEDHAEALLPHLSILKRLELVLGLRSTARLVKGGADAAFSDAVTGLRVAETIRDEPIFISQLVRCALGSLALRPIHAGLVLHRWTDPQLAEFQRLIAEGDYMRSFALALQGERAFSIANAEDCIARPEYVLQLDSMGDDRHGDDDGLLFLLRFGPHGWFRQNEMREAGRLTALLDAARAAASERGPRRYALATGAAPWPSFGGVPVEGAPRTVYNRVAYRLAYPRVSSRDDLTAKAARAEVTARLAVVACALERIRIARGEYPETLAALTPPYLDQPALDPITGELLHYARLGDGSFRLYSVGLNGRDDGGVYSPRGGGEDVLDLPWPPAGPTAEPRLF